MFESHADFAKYMSDSYMEIVKKGGPIDGVAKSKKIMEILESKGVKFVNQVTPDMYADIKAAVEELKND